MIEAVLAELKEVRDQMDTTFAAWFEECVKLCAAVDVEPAVQRTVARQRHRCNVPHSRPEEYYRRAICVPLLDHIIEQMATRFGPTRQKTEGLCCLVPSVVVSGRSVSRVDDLTKQ